MVNKINKKFRKLVAQLLMMSACGFNICSSMEISNLVGLNEAEILRKDKVKKLREGLEFSLPNEGEVVKVLKIKPGELKKLNKLSYNSLKENITELGELGKLVLSYCGAFHEGDTAYADVVIDGINENFEIYKYVITYDKNQAVSYAIIELVDNKYYKLKWFWTDVDYQKKGYGTKLLRFIVDKCSKENKDLKISSSDKGKQLYKKLVCREKKYNKSNAKETIRQIIPKAIKSVRNDIPDDVLKNALEDAISLLDKGLEYLDADLMSIKTEDDENSSVKRAASRLVNYGINLISEETIKNNDNLRLALKCIIEFCIPFDDSDFANSPSQSRIMRNKSNCKQMGRSYSFSKI